MSATAFSEGFPSHAVCSSLDTAGTATSETPTDSSVVPKAKDPVAPTTSLADPACDGVPSTAAVTSPSGGSCHSPANENNTPGPSATVDTDACLNDPETKINFIKPNEDNPSERMPNALKSQEFEMDKYFAVEKILNRRIVDGIVQYRVKWLGYPYEENTWEAEDDLDCPDEIEEFFKLQSKGDTNYSNKECDSESIHMKIKEISKTNLYLDQATEKNMDIIKMTISNCENGFKNIDHNGHENMGETTEVNTEDSQNKASIKILKTEANFTGFDVDDNLLSSIETKKNGIINIFSDVKSEPMEVSTPTNSPSIVNNNHVNKKNQSKSRVSSPESKHSKSNKRAKKDNVHSQAIESVDSVNVVPTLDNLEAMLTSSSTPEYVAEDWQAIQGVTAPTISPSKADDVEKKTTNNKKRNSEMNCALRDHPASMATMQSFNYMVKALRHVFKHLKTHELLSASRVCTAWNTIAMDKTLWQTVRLKNSMVCNWNKCINAIHDHATVTLDTRRMLIPSKPEDFNKFWLEFTIALKKAQQLKCLELYRCSSNVVEDTIYSLPQLTVLNATSIKNPNITIETKNNANNEFMTLNLHYLGQMTNLTEVRLKGLTGIKLTTLPSFESLVNLKSLSLTSFKGFPKDVCRSLETLSTSLAFFEIGDCDCLSKDFAGVLSRLTNLTSLRLENCCSRFENFAEDILCSIRGLEKLKILELINIEFGNNVEEGLEKCTNIKALLIIPAYVNQSATTNCHLIDCLKKLSKTLTHLVWVLTHELLRVTDLFLTQYQQNQHIIGYDLELSHTKEPSNNIPILRTRKPRHRPVKESDKDKDKDKSDNVDILSVPALEKLLETMMINAKTKVVKVPFSATTRVYLLEHFNDL